MLSQVRLSLPAPLRSTWTRVVTVLASPRGTRALHAVSVVLLTVVLGVYLAGFAAANWGMLTDPQLQTDDARTSVFPFHRYGSEKTLGDDPIANEMLALVPTGVRFLYRVTVPFVDVPRYPLAATGVP